MKTVNGVPIEGSRIGVGVPFSGRFLWLREIVCRSVHGDRVSLGWFRDAEAVASHLRGLPDGDYSLGLNGEIELRELAVG